MPGSGNGAAAIKSAGGRVRDGSITIRELVDRYMAAYGGRDPTRGPRLAWWVSRLGDMRLVDLSDDDIYFALEALADEHGRYWAGTDADGKAIYKRKRKPLAAATINRVKSALDAVLTWSIKQRIAPRDWSSPAKRVSRRAEHNHVVRFLSADERERLFAACRKSRWPKMYLFVALALSTGARRGELEGLRWADLDLDSDRPVARLHRSKNGSERVLPLVPAVVAELRKHQGAPSTLVFASKRRPDVAFNFTAVWSGVLKAAKIKRFRVHDLRHSCASYLAQSGAPLLLIAEVLGHRNLATTRRYSHLCVEDKTRVINDVLGALLK